MNSYVQGLSQDSWHTQAQGSWDGDYGDDQQEEYYDEFQQHNFVAKHNYVHATTTVLTRKYYYTDH